MKDFFVVSTGANGKPVFKTLLGVPLTGVSLRMAQERHQQAMARLTGTQAAKAPAAKATNTRDAIIATFSPVELAQRAENGRRQKWLRALDSELDSMGVDKDTADPVEATRDWNRAEANLRARGVTRATI